MRNFDGPTHLAAWNSADTIEDSCYAPARRYLGALPAVVLRVHQMARRFVPGVSTVLSLLAFTTPAVWAEDNRDTRRATEAFEKSVRPVLSANCFTCHGPDKQ